MPKRLYSDPTRSQVHIDTALSEIAIAYKPTGFIGDSVFPVVEVDKQSDKYYIWTKGFWMRNAVEKRTPGDTYPEGRLQLSNDEYYCDLYHLAFPIPDEDRQNADPGVELEIAGAEWLKTQFMLNREIKLASVAFATGSWATYKTGGTDFVKWDDYTDSDPISDVNAGIQTIQKSTGVKPNTLVVGKEVFDALAEHPNLIEKFKYTGVGILDEEQVRKALRVEKLLVGEAVQETSKEGAATATNAYIWGKGALLCYVPPRPGNRVPAAGYTFVWRINGAGGMTVPIENIREDNRDRDLLKGKHAFDDKVTGADLGYYFTSVIS